MSLEKSFQKGNLKTSPVISEVDIKQKPGLDQLEGKIILLGASGIQQHSILMVRLESEPRLDFDIF